MKTFAFLIVLAALPLLAGACPQRMPEGLKATVVGNGVAVNDMKLSILAVQGAEQASSVLDRVERSWRGEGFDVKRIKAGDWNIVSALSERCLATLQLGERGAAEGYFAVNPLAQARTGKPLMPPGARMLSSVSSKEDDGRRGTMSSLVSRQPVDTLREYYMIRLRADNWDGIRADGVGGKGSGKPIIVSAQRGRERIEVVLWREMETHIVINQADSL